MRPTAVRLAASSFATLAALVIFAPRAVAQCADVDGDGYFAQPGCGTPVDCNDADPNTHPGAVEVCDGYDNDCDDALDNSWDCDRICDNPRKLGDDVPIVADSPDWGLHDSCWNGNGFAVVSAGRPVQFQRRSAVFDAVGSPSSVTEGTPLGTLPSLAWTGSGYGVAWTDRRSPSDSRIYFARFDAQGQRIGGELPVSTSTADNASVIWNGYEFAVVWSTGSRVYFVRITAGGAILSTPLPLPTLEFSDVAINIAWTGQEYGAVVVTYSGKLQFQRIDPNGSLIGSRVNVNDSVHRPDGWPPATVWTGAEFAVFFADSANVYMSRFDASGTRKKRTTPSLSHATPYSDPVQAAEG
jgi:hypothetical protein